MRIITGRARGLKLTTPKNYNVRPTSDRVKESLFSILAGKISESRILDAFAGTGNLGLEAWSRGAEQVVFIDESITSLKLVKTNIAKAHAENEAKIIKGNALNIIEALYKKGEKFDIVFSDPPYDKGLNEKIYKKLLDNPILKSGGTLVLEHSAGENPLEYISADEKIRTQKYGDTGISLIIWK
jgi:16S rRNA (guanine966-N2)-methyltransferase